MGSLLHHSFSSHTYTSPNWASRPFPRFLYIYFVNYHTPPQSNRKVTLTALSSIQPGKHVFTRPSTAASCLDELVVTLSSACFDEGHMT